MTKTSTCATNSHLPFRPRKVIVARRNDVWYRLFMLCTDRNATQSQTCPNFFSKIQTLKQTNKQTAPQVNNPPQAHKVRGMDCVALSFIPSNEFTKPVHPSRRRRFLRRVGKVVLVGTELPKFNSSSYLLSLCFLKVPFSLFGRLIRCEGFALD